MVYFYKVKKKKLRAINSYGKIFWASGKPEKEDAKTILAKKEAFYQKYYSNFYDSYSITINKEIVRKIV